MGTGFEWGFWGFVSCKLWFQYLTPACSPSLLQGSPGRQGQSERWWSPAVTVKMEWMNIHNVTFQFLPCCWCSSGGSCQHSRWQALQGSCASGKLLSFVVHVCCACMWMCEGGSGANFHLLNYFQERMGNKWLPKDYKNYWHIKNQSLVLEEWGMSVCILNFLYDSM